MGMAFGDVLKSHNGISAPPGRTGRAWAQVKGSWEGGLGWGRQASLKSRSGQVSGRSLLTFTEHLLWATGKKPRLECVL